MRWPIRNQILLPFAFMLTLSIMAVSILNAVLAVRRANQELEARVQGIAATLGSARFPLTSTVLEQSSVLSGAQLLITSEAGEVIASSFPYVGPSPVNLQISPHGHLKASEVQAPGAPHWELVTGLPGLTESRSQKLAILYPQRLWTEAWWQAVLSPLLVGASALAIGAVLAVRMAATISRPLVELRQEVVKIAAGELQVIPTPHRDDEILDLTQSVNRLVESLQDLTARIRRSERLALLGQLSGGLAHHLRNTVAGAKLALQLHQQNCTQVDPESLSVALRQIALTEEQLKRFLLAGKPVPPQIRAGDPQKWLAEVCELIQPLCLHRQVQLSVHPIAPSPATIEADFEQLRQLLLNLLHNAIEAAGAGGWVRLELGSSGNGSFYLRVIDSGSGPPESVAGRLFEPFATSRPEGTGLGLAVSRTIAEGHGGTLRLKSTSPTCFELVIPQPPPLDASKNAEQP